MVRGQPLAAPEPGFYQRDNWATSTGNRLEKLDEIFAIDRSRCQHVGSVENPQGVPESLTNLPGEWAVVQLQENAYHVDNFGKYIHTIGSDVKEIPRLQSESTESSVHSPSSRQGAVCARTKKGGKSDDDDSRVGKRNKRTGYQRYSRTTKHDIPAPTAAIQTGLLIIGKTRLVSIFYSQRFKQLQQAACKTIAKAFVKLMEPKKQTNYPYSGQRAKEPYWWPKTTGQDMVRHREPDHLLKNERVRLLVHIIQVVVNQISEKSDSLYSDVKAVTVKRLEEVTQEAMAAWWADTSKPDIIKKRLYLEEIFKVAKQEERYRKGNLDPEASITIMHGDSIEMPDDEPEGGVNYNEEETAALTLTPTTSQCSSPGSMVSPHNVQFQSGQYLGAHEGESSEPFGYNPTRCQAVRAYLQQGHLNPAEEHQGYSDNSQMPMGPRMHCVSRQPLDFQQQNLLYDPNRRPPWQPNGYPSPPSSNFSNWTSTIMLRNGNMQYTNFTTGQPSQASAPAPYLPVPISQPLLPPPMHPQQHMPYSESVTGRPYDGLLGPPPRNPLDHPHYIPHRLQT